MEFTKNMQRVMERAVRLARENRHRYFMPEHMIYGMSFDQEFMREYGAAGGDIERLRKNLLGFLKDQAGKTEGENAVLTADTDRVLRMSEGQARASGRDTIGVSHFLSSVLRLEDSYGVYYLEEQDVDLVEVMGELSRESLAEERGRGSGGSSERAGEGLTPFLRRGACRRLTGSIRGGWRSGSGRRGL